MTTDSFRAALGFTLIEMVITLTVLSILTLAALPLAEGVIRHTKERELRSALQDIRKAIDRYKEAVDTGRLAPASASGYPADLQSLATGIPDQRNADKTLYFLRSIPRDPFCPSGTPTEKCWGLRAYESPPSAPHPGDDVFDVHSLSREVGSDGRAYREW